MSAGEGAVEPGPAGARPVVYVTRLIPEPGLRLLAEIFAVTGNREDRTPAREEIAEGLAQADAVVSTLRERIDAELLARAGTRLRVISNMAVGYDNIDVAAATERGILVTNTPGVLTETTADLAWALILGASRRVAEGDRMMRAGGFHGWTPTMLLGRDVYGKTLGIVGMGAIGRAVARRALGFDMRVLYTNRSGPLGADAVPAGARWEHRPALRDLLSEADIVSLHVPLTEATHHLLGRAELALMKPGAVLVNTARGPVVDEAALVEALRSGHLGAAGLDVYEDEPRPAPGLVDLPNTLLLPHLGSASVETRGRMAELAARNAIAAVTGGRVPHPVNPVVLENRE
ncbi:MAG: D-glycerate dehydrogenase [Thermoleophilia bacterium]